MYALLGYDGCLDAVRRAVGAAAADDVVALRARYRDWLTRLQGAETAGDPLAVRLVRSPSLERRLTRLFLDPDGDEASFERLAARLLGPRDPAAAERVLGDARAALETLRDAMPELGTLLELVVTTIFSVDLRGAVSGSVKEAVGVVLLNPLAGASVHDVREMLVHEFAHSLGYVDESTEFYFHDPEIAAEATAISAIRAKRRPVYYVLHSLIAACEILYLRASLPFAYEPRVHPPTDTLRASCRRALESVDALASRAPFTPRGERLFAAIRAFVGGTPDRSGAEVRAGVS